MTRRHAAQALIAVLLVASLRWDLGAHPPPQSASFRGGTSTVAVYATVRDRQGRLVPDLTQADFQVLDDGQPAEITAFSNDVLPFTAVLMLDMSNSMMKEYFRVRGSALMFVERLIPGDRVRIGTFGREVTISPLLTGDKTVLTRVIEEEVWPGGATPLWRATAAAMESLAKESGRRVILLLSDGGDSGHDYNCAPLVLNPRGRIGPCPSRPDVRTRALIDEFMFYGIGMEGAGLDAGVIDIADETGGGHFDIKRNADLDETFQRVADELHHQYVLGVTRGIPDGKTHKLEVRLKRPGLTAKARKSYFAGSDR